MTKRTKKKAATVRKKATKKRTKKKSAKKKAATRNLQGYREVKDIPQKDEDDQREYYEGRPIIYPEYKVQLCVGDKALTVEQAQKLLGWTTESENIQFGAEYLFKDHYGNKVRCVNNLKNRPLTWGNVLNLAQEILYRRWYFNFEPIIVGKTGVLLNGQHTLIALVIAYQQWQEEPDRWLRYGDTEPTIEKMIGFGCSEEDYVVNTMDTAKPRSLSEVIFRSGLFTDTNKARLKKLSKGLEFAVRLLWKRTRLVEDPFAPRRTHNESLDFINRHPKLLEAVKHVYEEDGGSDKLLTRFLSLGYMSGMLYLMGCSGSDDEEYAKSDRPVENMLDFSHWDKACDYLSLLAQGAEEAREVARQVALRKNEEEGISMDEKCALVTQGWNAYKSGEPITEEALHLEYELDDMDLKRFIGNPTVGGIDLGKG